MPQFIAYTSQGGKPTATPLVHLTLRGPDGTEKRLEFRQHSILIGTVPGCDLRFPAESLSPLIAVATIVPEGLKIRRLADGWQASTGKKTKSEPFRDSAQDLTGEATLRLRDEWACGEYFLRLDFLADSTLTEARKGTGSVSISIPSDLAAFKEQLEKDRQEWEAEAEKQAEKLAVQVRQFQEKEKQLQAERAELEQQKAASHTPKSENLEAVRQELLKLRDSLYQQYRQRRDAVVAMREAVRRAAFKIQEQKRELLQDKNRHHSALEQHRHEQEAFNERQNEIAKQAKLLEEWQRELNNDQRELAGKKEALALAQNDLENKTRELHADLVRLQRLQESMDGKLRDLDQRQELILEREQFIRDEHLKITAERSELERQERLVHVRDAWQVEKGKDLANQAAELLRQKEAVQKEAYKVQEHKNRLAQWEQQLGQDRLRLDRLQAEIAAQHEQLTLKQRHQQEEEATWKARQSHAEKEMVRLQEDAEKYQQLQAQREAIEQALAMKEAATEDLQEQLRCRTLALGQQEAQLNELNASYQMSLAEFERNQQDRNDQQRTWEATLQKEREHLEARRIALDEQAIGLQNDRQALVVQQDALVKQSQDLEQQLQQLVHSREEVNQQSENFIQAKDKLLESIPNLLRSAETALERLSAARTQLRSQVQDIHAYLKKCQAELGTSRLEVAQILKQIDERAQILSRLQDEQRLEAAVLRQDCLTWQAQIESLETKWRASHRQIEEETERNAARAKELAIHHSRLESQVEALEEKAHDIAYRRSEVNRHLAEMQDWYRHKLRDLAEKKLMPLHPWAAESGSAGASPSQNNTGYDEESKEPPDILPLKTTLNNSDQHLADLLSGMGLIDAITLQALLDEAGQQRISLRDCLLQNEFLTAYQLELIEAGQLESLVLNSLRVIDRVRIGSMETIYRVFDPRLSDEALLRHLSNNVDPEWRQEYSVLFQQASLIRHPNVARTLEVLEMSGSPAVVQEWLIGLPGTEWTSQVVEPSVALRLIQQIAAGLTAIHEAGLVHGQLQLGRLLLTANGELKLCGAGEPKWLNGFAATAERSFHDDVVQLSSLVIPWCRGKTRRHSKVAPRPMSTSSVPPEPEMIDFIRQLEKHDFASAAAFKKSVDDILDKVKPDEGAWQRLLQFVQDRLTAPESTTPQKKSA